MQSPHLTHILLTGLPGVGKTTLVEKLCEMLRERDIPLSGFFTKELRERKERVGFDVVSLDGKRSPLARSAGTTSGPRVGKYTVDVRSFEASALPLLQIEEGKRKVYVIDEIGKMELYSHRFMQRVHEIFSKTDEFAPVILGTIPIKKGKGIEFVENIRSRNDVRIFEVSRQNRDALKNDVMEAIMTNFTGD